MKCFARLPFSVWLVTLTLGFTALSTGCSFDPTLLASLPLPGNEPADSPAPVTVTIRFQNFSRTEAVDVEFFASNTPVENVVDELFVEENRVRTNIGVAGTGIIQPLDEDVIEFECTDNLTIGTAGGKFLDNDSGEERGGGTMRWLQEGPLALCGSVVTFVYDRNNDGFTTIVSLTR